MANETAIMELYRLARINIWVEDELTRQTLYALWDDATIQVMNAGSEEGVKHMVNGTEAAVRGTVFGVVDRDFRQDNRQAWADSSTRIFRLPAHEVENLLLDFDALARVSGQVSSADIALEAKKRARELLWWTACKGVLRSVVEDAPGVPRDPPQPTAPGQGVDDEASAVAHLAAPEYWLGLGQHHARWPEKKLRSDVAQLAMTLEGGLQSDAWRLSFPGKELLRHLRSKVPGLDTATSRQNRTERDLDLGKRLAAELRADPPQALVDLRAVLRQRVGLA